MFPRGYMRRKRLLKHQKTSLTLSLLLGLMPLANAGSADYAQLIIAAREGDNAPALRYLAAEANHRQLTANEVADWLQVAGWAEQDAQVLIGWAKYNQVRFRVERRSRRPGLVQQEVAKSFAITAQDVTALSSHDVLRVHHDEHGQITGIETLQPQR